jgi:hypothetical protein
MTDYRPLLSRAISGLDPNNGEARRAVYDRARTALVNQLRGMNPPLAEADITRERLALEDAIRKIEAENTPATPASPPPRSAPPRGAPAAPAAAAASRPVRPDPALPQPPRGPQPRPRSDANSRPAENALEPDDRFDEPYDAEAEREGAPAPRGREPRPAAADARGTERAPRGRAPEAAAAAARPRPGRGKTPADYAREDARRALRTKLVVLGIIAVLFVLAGVVGYVHRDRIFALIGPAGTAVVNQKAEPTKTPDRIPTDQTPRQQPQTQPLPPANPGEQRAVLFEENQGAQQLTSFNGRAVWRTETVNPGPGRSPDVGIRIDVEIPERKLTAVITIRRNPDPSLPASHYIEVQFNQTADAYGGIAQVPAVRMKNTADAQGLPLAGLSVRVMQGFFLIGLSAIETDRDRNLQLLFSQQWVDIPFVYNNGRRAVLTFEKGVAGENAMKEAQAAWR